ncbi:hypothetical protein [Oscillibacter sp.]|uniref:hypothetical protein n=1 Tax=Oscillibacter sp. TaxID=1945593 RepID=UPI00289F168C|nr:hypothetical protein [Oscillibacter sp.]
MDFAKTTAFASRTETSKRRAKNITRFSRSFFYFVVQCARECCTFLTLDVKQHHPMRRHLKTAPFYAPFFHHLSFGRSFPPPERPLWDAFSGRSILIKDKITNFSKIF